MALSKSKRLLLGRLMNPRMRPRERQFVVEGVNSALAVLAGRLSPEIRFGIASPQVLVSPRGQKLMERMDALEIPLDQVSHEEMGALSDTEQPQGILLVVREPLDPEEAFGRLRLRRVLLLDGVQDPGNAGTLIRVADAFGLDAVVALEGTVDPFNPKVVRASAGAVASIPVLRRSWGEVESRLNQEGIALLVGDAGGRSVRRIQPSPPWALVIGNEGKGPGKEIQEKAAEVLAVPMRSGADSLNAGVAGAILLFALCHEPDGARGEA